MFQVLSIDTESIREHERHLLLVTFNVDQPLLTSRLGYNAMNCPALITVGL